MKKLFLALPILFGVCHSLTADEPARISYSETADIVYRSSVVLGGVYSDVNLSSGVLKWKGVFVDSPGANSQLLMYDNYLAGTTTRQFAGPITSSFGWIEIPMTTSSGTVYTSTCVACAAVWAMPQFRFHYIRLR